MPLRPAGDRSRPLRRTPVRPGRRTGRTGAGVRRRSATAGLPLRPRLTSRAAVLVLVLAVLAVSYASSLRAYLDQRRHVASLQERITSSEKDIAALERERARWRDPAYVVAQARARFAFGFPGEVGFQVLDESGKPLEHEDSLSDPAPVGELDPEWWQTTLTSIQLAGNPPPEHEPARKVTAPPPPKSPE